MRSRHSLLSRLKRFKESSFQSTNYDNFIRVHDNVCNGDTCEGCLGMGYSTGVRMRTLLNTTTIPRLVTNSTATSDSEHPQRLRPRRLRTATTTNPPTAADSSACYPRLPPPAAAPTSRPDAAPSLSSAPSTRPVCCVGPGDVEVGEGGYKGERSSNVTRTLYGGEGYEEENIGKSMNEGSGAHCARREN